MWDIKEKDVRPGNAIGEENAELISKARNAVTSLEIDLVCPRRFPEEVDLVLPRCFPSDFLAQLVWSWELDTVPIIVHMHHGVAQEFEPRILLPNFNAIRLGRYTFDDSYFRIQESNLFVSCLPMVLKPSGSYCLTSS